MSNLKLGVIFMTMLSSLNAAALTLKFSELRNGNGFLAISIFSKEQKSAFPGDGDKATRTFYLSLDGKKELTLEVADLPPNSYAIAVMHDEDGDKKMKTNFLGIPQEGFGFSNNPKVFFGAPAFNRAEFDTSSTSALEIKLKYF